MQAPGAAVQVLAAVHGYSYTTAFVVSRSVVGAVLMGVLLPSGVLRQPGTHSAAPHSRGSDRELPSAPSRQRFSRGVDFSDWSVSAAVAYLFRGITRITMRVMMLKKKPRMANRMAL